MSEKEKRESEQKLVHELELIRDAKKLAHEKKYFQKYERGELLLGPAKLDTSQDGSDDDYTNIRQQREVAEDTSKSNDEV